VNVVLEVRLDVVLQQCGSEKVINVCCAFAFAFGQFVRLSSGDVLRVDRLGSAARLASTRFGSPLKTPFVFELVGPVSLTSLTIPVSGVVDSAGVLLTVETGTRVNNSGVVAFSTEGRIEESRFSTCPNRAISGDQASYFGIGFFATGLNCTWEVSAAAATFPQVVFTWRKLTLSARITVYDGLPSLELLCC
jgi:hypothetical protein